MCKINDSNLNGNNEHKKFTRLAKLLHKVKIIIKFLIDNSPNEFLYIVTKMTSCYISRYELNTLRKHEIAKNNARKLFLNNALLGIAIVLSVYALISTIIEKDSINYQTFNATIVYIVVSTLLIWLWALYTQYLVKKMVKKVFSKK